MTGKLQSQLAFIFEIDKIKSIFRKTKLFDKSRHENDAEHSWHLAMMAMVLSEHSNTLLDVPKVIKMVLIHDIPEIYTGDTIVYAKKGVQPSEEDMSSAKKVFGLLPEPQNIEFYALWHEFESKQTAESKFAAAIDRLEPVMQNYFTDADAWRTNKVKAEQVYNVNKHIANGSEELWQYAKSLIDECVGKGLIK